jgi:Flp pilus assembly protein TadB
VTGSVVLPAVLAGAVAALLVPPYPRRRLEAVLPRSARRSRAVGGAQGDAGGPDGSVAVATPPVLLASAACGLGLAVLVGGLTGAVLGVGAAGLTAVVLRRLEPRAVRERRERVAAGLPAAVDLLAACLAAGRPPADALAAVVRAVDQPLAHELSTVLVRLDLGADPVSVWRDLGTRPGPLAALGRTLARSLETGAPLADGLGHLAGDLRRRRRAALEQQARGVGVRAAAPLGLCFLPAFVLVGIVPSVISAFAAMAWW